MKIEDKRKDKRVTFINLYEGDCFCYLDGFYIKTENRFFYNDDDNGRFNAVSLKTGLTYYFADNEYVIKLNANVVIEDNI